MQPLNFKRTDLFMLVTGTVRPEIVLFSNDETSSDNRDESKASFMPERIFKNAGQLPRRQPRKTSG
jgi:hypothetical protein